MVQRLFFLLFSFACLEAFGQQPVDVQHYRYEVELSDASDVITGRAIITVRFLQPASQLKLDLKASDNEKGMQVFSVKEGNTLLRTSHTGNELVLYLTEPAKTGTVRTFEINYMGVPADGLIISRNKYGDRSFFSDNWPDRAHQWLPANDRPDDKATVEFIVTAPSHYRVISNGALVSERVEGSKKRTHWKEDIPIPTKVMVIGAARFAVARVDSAYRVPVTSWTYPQDSAKGAFDYALADDILRFFESYIGPYPYGKLANVQSKTIFGGMENANAIFYAENTVTGNRNSEALIAHEIAHQWFGNTATEKSFAHLWLSEGFATYLTNLYIEQKYGTDSFRKRLMEERDEVIAFARSSRQAVVDSTSSFMDLLNPNSYQKGAWFLHMLRAGVGDSVFRNIIRTYYHQYKHGNADTKDFREVAETVSGRQLAPFFNQWLYQPGIPRIETEIKHDKDDLKIKITQLGNLYEFPMDIHIRTADGLVKHQLIITSKETEFKLKAKGPYEVFFDPEVKLLFERKK